MAELMPPFIGIFFGGMPFGIFIGIPVFFAALRAEDIPAGV